MIKIYISFSGNCSEALQCYSQVFQSPVLHLIKHSDVQEFVAEQQNTILHAEMEIEGTTFIFSDCMETMQMGDNFSVLVQAKRDDIAHAYFTQLQADAEIIIPIGARELPGQSCSTYVNFKDRFGLHWIILCVSASQ